MLTRRMDCRVKPGNDEEPVAASAILNRILCNLPARR
jgi:hypothetical protein